jgi:hypothetical protein
MKDNQITSPEEKEYGFTVPGVVAMIPENLENALDVGCSGGGLGYYVLAIYENIYQKFINGKDCQNDFKQLFGSFMFDNDAVADFFTAQYHLLFRRDTVAGI